MKDVLQNWNNLVSHGCSQQLVDEDDCLGCKTQGQSNIYTVSPDIPSKNPHRFIHKSELSLCKKFQIAKKTEV